MSTGPINHLDARAGYTRTLVDDHSPMTAAQFEAAVGLLMDRMEQVCTHRERELQAAVKAAIDQAMSDEKAVKRFWRTGFDELSEHGANGASQWIGKRLLTGAIVAILFACLTWLVQTGRLK